MGIALLSAPASFAASVEGDEFTVTVTETQNPYSGSNSGIAGSAAVPDVLVEPDISLFEVEWIDGDTFELDWYSNQNVPQTLTIALTDLNFMEGGSPVDIAGVTKAYVTPGFDWDKNVSFTANSITIEYPFLDFVESPDGGFGNQAADGETVRYDVSTVPVPAALPLLASGLGIMGLVAARRRRKAA